MKLLFSLAGAVLLSSCFGLNTSNGTAGGNNTGTFSQYGFGGQGIVDSNGSLFGAQDPNAAFVQRSRARYGTTFLADEKPWMAGSIQEQVPSKAAMPGSSWKGPAPQTPVVQPYSMGSGAPAMSTK